MKVDGIILTTTSDCPIWYTTVHFRLTLSCYFESSRISWTYMWLVVLEFSFNLSWNWSRSHINSPYWPQVQVLFSNLLYWDTYIYLNLLKSTKNNLPRLGPAFFKIYETFQNSQHRTLTSVARISCPDMSKYIQIMTRRSRV